MTQSLGTTMKQQLLLAVSAVFFSSSAFANGGFEPNPKACVNVGKEINRVSTEMKVAKSVEVVWVAVVGRGDGATPEWGGMGRWARWGA